MKKLLAGCLVIVALGVVAVAVGSYWLYRAATPYIEDARSYFRGMSELGELDRKIANTSTFHPPASGELTESQVQRFARVQEHVRNALGQRMRAFEEKYQHLKSDRDGQPQPSLGELMSGLRDLAGVFVDARRYQVDALNNERFSQEEYSWVRARVFEAAGIEAASAIDLSKLQQAVRDGTGVEDFRAPELPEVKVPQKNRALVQPYVSQMDEWLPLVFFGL
jgi:hypothetical protein